MGALSGLEAGLLTSLGACLGFTGGVWAVLGTRVSRKECEREHAASKEMSEGKHKELSDKLDHMGALLTELYNVHIRSGEVR